jgi:hypothetical protein
MAELGKSHRSKVVLRRTRQKQADRASRTQAAQQIAAFQADLARRSRRRILAYACFVLGPIIFFGHIFEHAGAFSVFSPVVDDLLIGYPTAFALVITGFVLIGRD